MSSVGNGDLDGRDVSDKAIKILSLGALSSNGLANFSKGSVISCIKCLTSGALS